MNHPRDLGTRELDYPDQRSRNGIVLAVQPARHGMPVDGMVARRKHVDEADKGGDIDIAPRLHKAGIYQVAPKGFTSPARSAQ